MNYEWGRAMMELERETIDRMRAGQGQYVELVTDNSREAITREYAHPNESQRTAVHEVLANRDQVHGPRRRRRHWKDDRACCSSRGGGT